MSRHLLKPYFNFFTIRSLESFTGEGKHLPRMGICTNISWAKGSFPTNSLDLQGFLSFASKLKEQKLRPKPMETLK